jgi:hypothetical protein
MLGLGTVIANNFQGILTGGVQTNSIETSTTNDLVISRGAGTTSKISSTLPIQLDGSGATDKQIRNVTDILGPVNGVLHISSRGATGLLNLQSQGFNALTVFPSANIAIGNILNDPLTKLYVDGDVELASGYNVTASSFIGNLSGTASEASNLAGRSARKLPYYNATQALSYASTADPGFIASTDGNDVQFVDPASLTVGSAGGASNVLKGQGLIYNDSTNTTGFSIANAVSGQLLQSQGTLLPPTYVSQATLSVGSATTATNIASGAANQLVLQTGANTTSFVAAPTTGQILTTSAVGTTPIFRTLTQIPSQMFNITGWTAGSGGDLGVGQDILRSPTAAVTGYFIAPSAACTLSMDLNGIPLTLSAALGTSSFLQIAIALFNATGASAVGGFPAAASARPNAVIPFTGATTGTVFASCRAVIRLTGLTVGTGYSLRLIAFGNAASGNFTISGATAAANIVGTFAVTAL